MKQRTKKMWLWLYEHIPKTVAGLMPDLFAIAGAVAIVRGVTYWSVPFGWIAAGILLLAAAVIWSKGGSSG